MLRLLPVLTALLVVAGCRLGGDGNGDGEATSDIRARRLRGCRLRQLPHARGRGVDRLRRPESRRREPVVRRGRPEGEERRRRNAVVRGRAERAGDSRRGSFVSGEDPAARPRRSGRDRPVQAEHERLQGCLDTDCRRQAFGNIAYREGAKPALDLFDEKQLQRGGGRGRLPPDRPQDRRGLAPALRGQRRQGTRRRATGLRVRLLPRRRRVQARGLSEARASHRSRPHRSVSRTKIRKSGSSHYQCVHGLGHGLMIYTRYDLPGALRRLRSAR